MTRTDPSRHLRKSRWLWLLTLLGGCAIWSCNCSGPAFLVVVDFDAGLDLTQLRFTGSNAQRTFFGPVVRPAVPAGILQSEQTVLVELPTSLQGQPMFIEVDGLVDGGEQVASGISAVAVAEIGYEPAVTVVLQTDAGVDGG